MKWHFKVFLLINVLLFLGSNYADAHSFHHAQKAKTTFFSACLTHLKEGIDKRGEFTPLIESNDLSKLSAPEFEDDNAGSRGAKKQNIKINPADIFLADRDVNFNTYIVKSNLPAGKLSAAAALNKIYLNIRVFRL